MSTGQIMSILGNDVACLWVELRQLDAPAMNGQSMSHNRTQLGNTGTDLWSAKNFLKETLENESSQLKLRTINGDAEGCGFL